MQTSSCFIVCVVCVLLAINLSCTHAKKTRHPKSRDDHVVKEDKVTQDIDVRAILIRCPQENGNEVFHSNPKSISNISALRTDAILQFPGYDSDEARFHSNVVKCQKKIVIYLKIRKTGKIPTEDKFIIVNHVFDQLTGKKARLLNPYVFKIKQEPSYEMYPLKFTNLVNAEATEEVISKSSSNYTGCDDGSDNPTCGFAFHRGQRVPYSQGFCCSCDASVNAERQPGPHRGDVDGGVWKPDASFRQTGKTFESSDTISASKINQVKENALAELACDGETSKNDSRSRQNVDAKKDHAAISAKGSSKSRGNAKGKHHSDTKSSKAMKSTTCEPRKWRTSSEHVSEVSTTTTACTKQPAKKSSLSSNSTCATESTSTLESVSPGVENLSPDSRSEATSPAGDRGSVPPLATTPANFVVTTAADNEETSLKTTDIWLESEMYRVSSHVTKVKSANTITTESPSTGRLASGNSPSEGNKVQANSETKKKTHHASTNLPCTDKPKKYHHHMPSDPSVNVIGALKMAKQSVDNLSHTTKQTPEKCKSSTTKNKPHTDKGAEDVISSVTKPDTLAGEISTAGDSKNSETPTKVPILNDFPSEEVTNLEQTSRKESCTSPQQSLPTTAKWTEDKLKDADTETVGKFATASSLLELPGLDWKVNNLHNDEQFELSTENVGNSISLADRVDVLSGVKGEIGGGGYLQSGDNCDGDSAEETAFQKKEIIAKDIKSILAASRTECAPLESLGDVVLDKANEVSPCGSEPCSDKETKLSGRLSQDEINDIILASNQELEIEPHMTRKRRKEDDEEGRESGEGDSNGSSSSTRTSSCPLDSSGAKNKIRQATAQKRSPTKMEDEDGSRQLRDKVESALRRTVDSDEVFEPFGRKPRRFPSTRLDYFNELERQRLEDKFHAGKSGKVKREAIFETPADATSLDSAISGEQQVNPAISDDESRKPGGETKGVDPVGKTVNADDASHEPLAINFPHSRENCSSSKEQDPSLSQHVGELGAAKLKLKNVSTMKAVKTTSAYETSTVSSRSTDKPAAESEGKAIKNSKQCIRINPLSKMPSIVAKLNSLNRVSSPSLSKPVPISPAGARAKSRPRTEPPPGSAEEKLDALLKDLQRKLMPLIEDAEDKKVIAAEEEADRVKNKNRGQSCKKHKRRSRRDAGENRESNFKRSDGNFNKRSKRRTDLVKRRQYPVGKQTPALDEGASSEETVGYEPHYMTDQVPSEKARLLDLKGGAQHKDKEKCAPAVLNTKSTRTSDTNHFADVDSRSKDYKGADESEGRAYLELVAAIAADSLREGSCEEKPPIDGVNAGIDTPICESSFNLLANDYSSFVDDEEDEDDDDESESFHCEAATGEKSAVSEDSLSFFPVGSNENDYLDVVDTEADVRVNEEKEFTESRSKRNPHGGVRKNHLKIPMSSEDIKLAKNCNENKESGNKRQHGGADADADYITLRFAVDDADGVLLEGEGDGDDDAHLARQKRQVLAGGHQVRGGQNCVDRSTPACVNPKTYHESAHCLRFSDLWYAVYKVNEPEIVRKIYVQIYEKRTAEDGGALWVDHTHGKMIGLGTNNPKPLDFLPALSLEFHSEDVCSVPFALNASSSRLLVPEPVCKDKTQLYPQLQGGPGEYLVLDKNLVASDADASGADACDVAGVGFEGFARQDDRCGRPRGSCLRNQPVQFWRADIEARLAGRQGHYLLENFAHVPDNPIKTDKDGEQFLALELDESQESFVGIELEADSNTIIRVGTSVQITEIHSDSTTPGVSDLTVVLTNTGLASARFLARIADCPMEAPKEWTAAETRLQNVAPQRNVRMQLRLLGEMLVESMHCSVEVLNAARELVATRRVRLQLNDRCFCVWWCLCACMSSVDGLKCRPMSQHHHAAAGFGGGVPITEPSAPSGLMSPATLAELSRDWVQLSMLVCLVVFTMLLLIGLTKAIIGATCSPAVGAWGLFALAFKPHRIKQYYEEDLRDLEVVYDRQGYPVHPHTGKHSVQAHSPTRQFLLNVPLFVLLVPAALARIIMWYTCRQASRNRCPEKGCNDNMCFDSYDHDDARDDAAMNYVASEMHENRPAVVASFAEMREQSSSERSSLLPPRASSRGKKHSKRAPSKACRKAAAMLEQEFAYRFFMRPHKDVAMPRDIPYCLRGHLSWDGKQYVWEPTKPLEQNWTFNGDLQLMEPPRKLDPKKFVLRYPTAQEMYDHGVVSDRVIGFCINVVLKDGAPLPMNKPALRASTLN